MLSIIYYLLYYLMLHLHSRQDLGLRNVQLSLHLACSDKVTASDLCLEISRPPTAEAKNSDEVKKHVVGFHFGIIQR